MLHFGRKVIKFLVDNWQALTSILLSCIVLIIAIVKKRPLANLFDHDLLDVFDLIPDWINEAEESKLIYGSDKKLFVLNKAKKYLTDHVLLPGNDVEAFLLVFDVFIEKVLSTPRKKKN